MVSSFHSEERKRGSTDFSNTRHCEIPGLIQMLPLTLWHVWPCTALLKFVKNNVSKCTYVATFHVVTTDPKDPLAVTESSCLQKWQLFPNISREKQNQLCHRRSAIQRKHMNEDQISCWYRQLLCHSWCTFAGLIYFYDKKAG